jgi:hypothetical protein
MVLALAAIAAGAAAGQVSTANASTRGTVTCSETFKTGTDLTDSPQGAVTQWTQNSCTWVQRVRIRCLDPHTGTTDDYYGGWTHNLGIDGRFCDSASQSLIKAGIQYGVAPGVSITNKWFWTK